MVIVWRLVRSICAYCRQVRCLIEAYVRGCSPYHILLRSSKRAESYADGRDREHIKNPITGLSYLDLHCSDHGRSRK